MEYGVLYYDGWYGCPGVTSAVDYQIPDDNDGVDDGGDDAERWRRQTGWMLVNIFQFGHKSWSLPISSTLNSGICLTKLDKSQKQNPNSGNPSQLIYCQVAR